MKTKRYMVICLEGWYYLCVLAFIIIGAMLRDINLLMMVAGMMVGPMLYNWWAVIVALRRIEVHRKLPEGICAGDLLVTSLTLSNHNPRHACFSVVVEDSVRHEAGQGRGERSRCGVLFAHVPAGESQTATYSGRLTRRGRYRFGTIRVSTRYPLGLVRRTLAFDARQAFTVYPRLGRLTDRWNRLHQDTVQGSHRVRQKQGALEGEFFGLRDWRMGDSRRWIHWRTSARRGTLAVRQFEHQRNQDMLLLVDLWRPDAATREELERVELAVSFAATAMADLCRRGGCKLALGVAGKHVQLVHGAASQMLLAEMMELLALAEPTREDRIDDLLAQAESLTPAPPRTVLVSTRPIDLTTSERWHDPEAPWAGQLAGGRLIAIDAGSEQLAEYYWSQ